MQLSTESRRVASRAAAEISQFFLAPIDARIYALTRIGFAAFCFCLVLELWPMRSLLFADSGMMPARTDLFVYLPLAHVHTSAGITALTVLAGAASLLLAAGCFSRAALLYLYVWSLGCGAVAYPAEAGYDAITRIVSLVLLCSPGLRAWSVDARIFGPGPALVPRYGLRLLQWQLVLIYVATVWLKAPDAYWRSGEFMAYFMMSLYSRVPGAIWAELGRTSVLLTWGALVMETCIPILLCGRYRRLGILCGIALHGGIGLSSTIGMFSIAMLPLYASFVQLPDLRALRLVRAPEASAS